MSINAEDSYISTLMSLADSPNGGVTSVLDHAHEHTDAMLRAHIDSGVRVWNAYNLVPIAKAKDGKFFLDPVGQEKVDGNGSKWSEWQRRHLGPMDECNLDSLGRQYETGKKSDTDSTSELNVTVVTLHTLGAPFQTSGPYSNLGYQLDQWGYLNINYAVVFSHSTTNNNDLEILRRTNHFFSVTPESEHHYNHGQPIIHTLLSQAALGANTSSTFSSVILARMRLQLQSTRLRMAREAHSSFKYVNNTTMTVKQAFLLGTCNGGIALHRPDIGVIKKGAKADAVVFNTDNTATFSFYDPIAAVVLHSHVGSIEHVLVDEKFVKRDFKLVGLDWKKMKATFDRSAETIQTIWLEYDKDWSQQRAYMLLVFFEARRRTL
ncbi:hypothetical protein BGW39_007245 [Mortierella sp. 14UC]|nr:hypothetical protein BGW39_007245 [Mortierella sp. 14UC]